MNLVQIETWALRVINSIQQGNRQEDNRVELKTDWPPDAKAAARRIAAHANAARGEPILWLIGVDEETGAVRGVQGAPDVAPWYDAVRSNFDEIAPSLQHVVVDVGVVSVAALLFETDRAPFVVKNPAFGSQGGGSVQREVPWREGTATRSATRNDLLLLLEPTQRLPEIELRTAELTTVRYIDMSLGEMLELQLDVGIYAVPRQSGRVVIPFHRCSASVEIPGWSDSPADLKPSMSLRDPSVYPGRENWHTGDELVLGSPAAVVFHAFRRQARFQFDSTKPVAVRLQIAVVGAVNVLPYALVLEPRGDASETPEWFARMGA